MALEQVNRYRQTLRIVSGPPLTLTNVSSYHDSRTWSENVQNLVLEKYTK